MKKEESTEGFISGLLLSAGFGLGIGAIIILLVMISIAGNKIFDNKNKKNLKNFIDDHKDLIDIINKRLKSAKITENIKSILKELDNIINNIPGYESYFEDYENFIDEKTINSILENKFTNINKNDNLKEILKKFEIGHGNDKNDNIGIHFTINRPISKKYVTDSNNEYPDIKYDKIENDFNKLILNPLNNKINHNYKVIFGPSYAQGDDYIITNNLKSDGIIQCHFAICINLNIWDELKLDDIYDKLENEKQSKENIYSALYLMDL